MEEEQQQHLNLLSIREERKEEVMLEGEKEESLIQKEEMKVFSQGIIDLMPDSSNCKVIFDIP